MTIEIIIANYLDNVETELEMHLLYILGKD